MSAVGMLLSFAATLKSAMRDWGASYYMRFLSYRRPPSASIAAPVM